MSTNGIVQWGDPVLRSQCAQVEQFTDQLAEQAAHMVELMHAAGGVGLAAPQAGMLNQLAVIQLHPEELPLVLINPQLRPLDDQMEPAYEGCLSLPGVRLPVLRHLAVEVDFQDPGGERHSLQAEGLLARALQHETDHLGGILILDRVDPLLKREAIWAMNHGQQYGPALQGEPRGQSE